MQNAEAAINKGEVICCRSCNRDLFVVTEDIFLGERLKVENLKLMDGSNPVIYRLVCPYCLEPWSVGNSVYTRSGWIPKQPKISIGIGETIH